MFLYLKIFLPKMKIFTIFALITPPLHNEIFMHNDYIIANHRLRIVGPESDLTTLGLAAFLPFAVEYSADAKCDVEINLACDAPLDVPQQELTRFDFAEGDAECVFSRTEEEYRLSIANKNSQPHIFSCRRNDTSCVRTNAGALPVNPSFLRFGIWFMVNINLVQRQFAAVHSSAIICNDKVVLFLGESGTGKSTHTRLWRENIEGATLLNDDSPFVGVCDGRAVAFGSPWSGKTHCYKNERYPIRAIVRLLQAPHNAMRRLKGVQAIGALLPSLPPAFAFDERLEDCVMDVLSAIVGRVPVYHLECLPDAAAAELSYRTIYGKE